MTTIDQHITRIVENIACVGKKRRKSTYNYYTTLIIVLTDAPWAYFIVRMEPSFFDRFFDKWGGWIARGSAISVEESDPADLTRRELYQQPSPNKKLLTLIEKYPDKLLIPFSRDSCCRGGNYPLHMALRCGVQCDIVQAILKARPAAAKLQDSSGKLPLHLALMCAPKRAAELVLEAYPDGCQKADNIGCLPLHYACAYDKIAGKVMNVYPDALKVVDSFKALPIHHAITCGASDETIQSLVDAFPDGMLQQDKGGSTPLHRACSGVGLLSKQIDVARLVSIQPDATKIANHRGELPIDTCVFAIIEGQCCATLPYDIEHKNHWQEHFWALVEAFPESLLSSEDRHRERVILPLQLLACNKFLPSSFWERVFCLCPSALVTEQWTSGDVPFLGSIRRYFDNKEHVLCLASRKRLVDALIDSNSPEGALLRCTYRALVQLNLKETTKDDVDVPWIHMVSYCLRLFNTSTFDLILDGLEKGQLDKVSTIRDSVGNTPIHVACMAPSVLASNVSEKQEQNPESARSGLVAFLGALNNKSATSERNYAGEMPIHIYLKSQRSHYKLHDIKCLAKASDVACVAKDIDTQLHPFMLAALGKEGSLDVTYYLLKQFIAVRSLGDFL